MIILYIVFTQFAISLIIYKQEEKTMAEFCPKCFIKLNPEFSRSDLKIVKEPTLCEGCGEIVPKIVIGIKEYAVYYRKKSK